MTWSMGELYVQTSLPSKLSGFDRVLCAQVVSVPSIVHTESQLSADRIAGPVMAFGWLISALFIALIFRTNAATALTIAACLTPTDPVLASSILSNSQFSSRVPKRIKDMLSAESGCNDGISFP